MNEWILANAALKGTLVLAAAWLVTRVLKRRSAAVRHLVWTAAYAAVLALPFLTVGLPAWRVPVSRAILPIDTGSVFRAFGTASNPVASPAATPAQATAQPAAPARPGRDWRRVPFAIWALGSAAMLLQMLAACAALWRARRGARPF